MGAITLDQAFASLGHSTLQGFDTSNIDVEGAGRIGGSNSGKNRQYVKFYKVRKIKICADPAKTEIVKVGVVQTLTTVKGYKPVTEDVEFVKIINPGENGTEIDQPASDEHRATYWREYQAFRQGKTGPIGEPIENCEFIPPGVAIELKTRGCHTLEQLAEASDLLCGIIPTGFTLRDLAKMHVKVNAENKNLGQVTALQNQVATMQEELAKLKANQPLIFKPSDEPIEDTSRGPTNVVEGTEIIKASELKNTAPLGPKRPKRAQEDELA